MFENTHILSAELSINPNFLCDFKNRTIERKFQTLYKIVLIPNLNKKMHFFLKNSCSKFQDHNFINLKVIFK